jgi:hypothetical protein
LPKTSVECSAKIATNALPGRSRQRVYCPVAIYRGLFCLTALTGRRLYSLYFRPVPS